MSKSTNIQIGEFLNTSGRTTEIQFLEEGSKEKKDLINSAKKRGILVEGSRDLGIIKTIYAFTNKPNANGAMLPSKEFQKKYPQIVGKPMNIGHQRDLIVGFYIDYKYILKENKAIAYSIFFKSNYPKLWAKAKKFQKQGKLSSSFEIWNAEKDRTTYPNGSYSLNKMEIAGGALIFEEKGELPAFKDAKVLSIARKDLEKIVTNEYLVFASKYKEKDLITADYFKDEVRKNIDKLNKEKQAEKEVKVEAPKEEKKEVKSDEKLEPKEEVKKEETIKPDDTISKIKCSNCQEAIDLSIGLTETKCPKCFAILDSAGTMKYPPQIKDFKVMCPSCQVNNWLILSNKEAQTKLRCLSCAKEYQIDFKVKTSTGATDKEMLLQKINFLYTGFARCHQCGNSISVIGTSLQESNTIKCDKCGLEFIYAKAKADKYRQIMKIAELTGDKKESSEKGGNEVDKEKVEKPKVEENKEEKIKVEEPKVEVKEEKTKEKASVEVDKVEEPIETESIPENEEKAEAKVEEIPKSEDTLKEESSETPKVKTDDKVIEQVETTEESTDLVKEKIEDKVEITEPSEKSTQEEVEPKKASVIRKAVKKIIDLKKKIRLTKASTENKVIELEEGIKKVASQLIEAQAEIKKIKSEADKKIKFYSDNAKLIIERKEELGDEFAEGLSDKDILDEDKFIKAKLEKENTLLRAQVEGDTEIVGDKQSSRDEGWYAGQRKKVDDLAFGSKNKKEKKEE